MSSARLLWLIAALASAGCTTMEEIRQAPPARAGQLNVGYKDVAACVAYELAGRFNISSAIFETQKKAVLSYVQDNTVGPLSSKHPMFELTIAENGPDRSFAELRTVKAVISDYWPEKVWPTVEKCGRVT